MNSFDKVIGYSAIKKELMQICDMIKNNETYEALGASLPQGILLYGDPGLGKTLIAKCFLEECNLTTYTLRRNKGNDDFVGEITDTFGKAKANAPAVIFLDDIDKFANEDYDHRDAEEYVAIQSGIDEVKGEKVFILATANDTRKLPNSLTRAGRFDRKIRFQTPNKQDAIEIIKYYLSNKAVSDDVDMEDLSRMFSYSSCAELETIINEAAITAGGKRKSAIEMEDLIEAILREQYDSPDDYTKGSEEDAIKTALHEAGHIVVAEVLLQGSVGLASIRPRGRNDVGGFVHRCESFKKRAQNICTALGGKAAVELYYAGESASGCYDDINRAAEMIRNEVTNDVKVGMGMFDISTRQFPETTENYKARNEAVVYAELEKMMFKTREILVRNKDFLEKVRDELVDKETLLHSDIQRIRSMCSIKEVAL